ncbi:MAG: 3-oxoacyl-ACP synthase [Pseudomonadota bacterium]
MRLIRFESIGAFIPEKKVSTDELMSQLVCPQPIDLIEITGIRERRMLQSKESSFTAARDAALDCLKHSKYQPKDIEVIISCSISRTLKLNPDSENIQFFFDPPLSHFIKNEVGMHSAINFDVSNACAGMMTGVHLLKHMIEAGVVKNGMVVSGEQISDIAITATKEIQHPWDSQFGSLTIGDSGVAVIVDDEGIETDKIDYLELVTCAEYADLCIGKPSEKTPSYALYTNNAQMHKKERLLMWPAFQNAFFEKTGKTFKAEKFDYIIHHQVGLKFVDMVNKLAESFFGTSMPPAINCLEELGNTASTSHFITLYKFLQKNKPASPIKILMVPAASGLITGMLSTTISNLKVSPCEQ